MTYHNTLDYLYKQLPMFHRIGAAAYKANLNNTHEIMNALNHPHKKFKSIHVAGTNGKGSVSHMLASILQHAGYKVGLYTSPHLKDFRERIRINGKMISKKYVVDFVMQHKTVFEKIQPSFFEWTVGLAFQYFSDKKVDIAVIETGLGGRLDSTNVIEPILSIITNVSYDHTNLLGNTLEKIAIEKAGIIKNKTLVLIGERQKYLKHVFEKKCKIEKAEMVYAEQLNVVRYSKTVFIKGKPHFQGEVFFEREKVKNRNVFCDLSGIYQQKNIATVLSACDLLNNKNKLKISSAAINNGLLNVVSTTGLQGRWQMLSTNPITVCDVAHNEAGIKEVVAQIKITPHKKLHFVLGVVSDKDIASMLRLLPKNATYYFCKANIPRALDAEKLKEQASQFDLHGKVFPSVKSAFDAAKKSAKKNEMIFVGGSTFTVAEVL